MNRGVIFQKQNLDNRRRDPQLQNGSRRFNIVRQKLFSGSSDMHGDQQERKENQQCQQQRAVGGKVCLCPCKIQENIHKDIILRFRSGSLQKLGRQLFLPVRDMGQLPQESKKCRKNRQNIDRRFPQQADEGRPAAKQRDHSEQEGEENKDPEIVICQNAAENDRCPAGIKQNPPLSGAAVSPQMQVLQEQVQINPENHSLVHPEHVNLIPEIGGNQNPEQSREKRQDSPCAGRTGAKVLQTKIDKAREKQHFRRIAEKCKMLYERQTDMRFEKKPGQEIREKR